MLGEGFIRGAFCMGGGDRIDLREPEPWYMRPTPRVPSQASNRCFLATRAPRHDDELIGGPPARSLASFLVGLRFSSGLASGVPHGRMAWCESSGRRQPMRMPSSGERKRAATSQKLSHERPLKPGCGHSYVYFNKVRLVQRGRVICEL